MSEKSLTAENEVQSTELVIPDSLPVVVEEQKLVERRRGLPGYFWLVVGVGAGVAGTLAAVSLQKPDRSKTYAQLPPVSAPASNSTATGAGVIPPGTQVPGVQVPGAQTAGAQLPGSQVPGAAVPTDKPEAPMNPFGGSSFVLPKLPAPAGAVAPPLKGDILSKNLPVAPQGEVAVTPPPGIGAPTGRPGSAYINKLLAQGVPKAPIVLKAPSILKGTNKPATTAAAKPAPGKPGDKSTLVTVNQLSNDRQGAADDLIAYVGKIGGKAQVLTEQGGEGKPEIKGVLATVPEGVVKDLLKHVTDAGAVVDKQTWTGPSTERKAKLVEDAESRIASLKKLREALLVTYLEDAQPVKEVDEEIAKAGKSLEQLQTDKAGEKMAIVRISFVAK